MLKSIRFLAHIQCFDPFDVIRGHYDTRSWIFFLHSQKYIDGDLPCCNPILGKFKINFKTFTIYVRLLVRWQFSNLCDVSSKFPNMAWYEGNFCSLTGAFRFRQNFRTTYKRFLPSVTKSEHVQCCQVEFEIARTRQKTNLEICVERFLWRIIY